MPFLLVDFHLSKMQRFTLAMGDNTYRGEFHTANVKNNKRLVKGMLR
jgi:hypothetical protein